MLNRKDEIRKTYLEKRQKDIEEKINSIGKSLADGTDSDKELELKTLLREHESNQLIAKRLENGNIILCRLCGEQISEKRLRAQKTDLCACCANKEEEHQKTFGIPTHHGYGCESRL